MKGGDSSLDTYLYRADLISYDRAKLDFVMLLQFSDLFLA